MGAFPCAANARLKSEMETTETPTSGMSLSMCHKFKSCPSNKSPYPRYVSGCNGAELVNFVMEDNLPEYDFPHEFYADRSPEYWTGWTLAYFQWRQNLSFKNILQKYLFRKSLTYICWGMSRM